MLSANWMLVVRCISLCSLAPGPWPCCFMSRGGRSYQLAPGQAPVFSPVFNIAWPLVPMLLALATRVSPPLGILDN